MPNEKFQLSKDDDDFYIRARSYQIKPTRVVVLEPTELAAGAVRWACKQYPQHKLFFMQGFQIDSLADTDDPNKKNEPQSTYEKICKEEKVISIVICIY